MNGKLWAVLRQKTEPLRRRIVEVLGGELSSPTIMAFKQTARTKTLKAVQTIPLYCGGVGLEDRMMAAREAKVCIQNRLECDLEGGYIKYHVENLPNAVQVTGELTIVTEWKTETDYVL